MNVSSHNYPLRSEIWFVRVLLPSTDSGFNGIDTDYDKWKDIGMSSITGADTILKDVINIINTPETYITGERFEHYVREKLFTRNGYTLVTKAHGYAANKDDFIEDTLGPDLKFRSVKTGKEFFVESKYRSYFYRNAVEWCQPHQIKRFKRIARTTPVYVVIGVGNSPDSPEQVFLLPLDEVRYTKLFKSSLKKYEIPVASPVDDALIA